MLSGIDVSRYQGQIDWSAVAAGGVSFAFAKATESNTITDSCFAQNWPAIKAAGLVRGAYHFFRPGVDPALQAQRFLAVAKIVAGDLPAVLDVEAAGTSGAASLLTDIATWLDVVAGATGRPPIIYTSPGFWNPLASDRFGAYPLWVAHYTAAPAPTIPKGWRTYAFWQYSQTGQVPGVSGNVDQDWFNGDRAALLALAQGQEDEPSPPPDTGAVYIVQTGDTLTAIANRAGMSVQALAALNGITDPNKIFVGQTIRLTNSAG